MSYLKDHIIASYDDNMKDYLESDDVQEAGWAANKLYFKFRAALDRLDPEMCQEFDELLNAYEENAQAEKEEAYYRGVMAGIAERDNFR